MVQALQGADFDGRTVNVEVTDNAAHGGDREGRRRGGEGGKRSGAARRIEEKAKRGGRVSRDPMAEVRKRGAGRSGKPEWAQFFEGQVENQPFYGAFEKKKHRKGK